MPTNWDPAALQAQFAALLKRDKNAACGYSSADWDARAAAWERELLENDAKLAAYDARVAAMAAFLRDHGLLGPRDTVLDIGCGLGRFAVEFSRTCAQVTAVDLSPRMLRSAQAHAARAGRENLRFLQADFTVLDLNTPDWDGAFDLVFAAQTPALSSARDLARLEQASRAYCCTSSFVQATDDIAEAALARLCPPGSFPVRRNGRNFYALLNLLWLQGRFPVVAYHTEQLSTRSAADKALAQDILRRYRVPGDPDVLLPRLAADLAAHADADGRIPCRTMCRYGWLLWNRRITHAV